ncbi:hypothetical protein [Chromobacterium sphagni]|uniref:Uncharacterized protein n=1 Tax=Chromobacterium sphagni TaxID=1903179 RepID=A0ABX3CFZ3_9NEIS|nr:hypothetical protein [Chromobacterium sphagni]OHX21236.1 hypothetical protein BI344_01465 [Chromobacterium sphagni]
MSKIQPNELEVGVIESIEELERLPGYTKDIDPKAVKLDKIVYFYRFPDTIRCGKENCHRPHLLGFVVRLEDGRLTNVGNVCGKDLGAEKFLAQSKMALRYIERRQVITSLQARRDATPSLEIRLAEAKSQAKEITDFVRRLEQTIGVQLVNLLKAKARRSEYDVYDYRELTKKQIKIRDVMRRTSSNVPKEIDTQERYKAGTLEYINFFAEDVRSMIFEKVEPAISSLQNSLLDEMRTPDLNRLSRSLTEAEVILNKMPDIANQAKAFAGKRNNFILAKILTKSLEDKNARHASAGIERYMHEMKW